MSGRSFTAQQGKLVGWAAGELKLLWFNPFSALLTAVLTPAQKTQLLETYDLDLALQLPCGRFRVSMFRQQRGFDAVFRPISATPPTIEQLGLPPSIKRLTEFHQGLVLVTGPAGCGKSSTLAALVSHRIVTWEARHRVRRGVTPIYTRLDGGGREEAAP